MSTPVCRPAPASIGLRRGWVAALSTLALASAHGAPLPYKGDVDLRAFVAAVKPDNLQEDTRLSVPPGDPAVAEAYVRATDDGWFGGERVPGRPAWSFASAAIAGNGVGGVGTMGGSAAGWDPGLLAAHAEYRGSVTNLGDSGTVTLEFEVPLMQLVYHAPQFHQELASVRAWLDARVYGADGDLVQATRLFDYDFSVTFVKVARGPDELHFDLSPDLEADADMVRFVVEDVYAFPQAGMRIDPFRSVRSLQVPAFGRIDYAYQMDSTLWTGHEGSGWALYGDPFDVDGGAAPALSFTIVRTASVPEPGAAGLAAVAWPVLLWLSRGRRAGMRRPGLAR